MRPLVCCLVLGALSYTSSALAGDAVRGRVLAENHCGVCHIVVPNQRNEVADAPPFETIGRKHGFDATLVAQAILSPHPKMNFSPAQADADDIAAYIGTLPH